MKLNKLAVFILAPALAMSLSACGGQAGALNENENEIRARVYAAYACADIIRGLQNKSRSDLENALANASEASSWSSNFYSFESDIIVLLNPTSQEDTEQRLSDIFALCDAIID